MNTEDGGRKRHNNQKKGTDWALGRKADETKKRASEGVNFA